MGTSEQAGGKFRDGEECAGWDMAERVSAMYL
ncbi:hypothetical protein GGR43_004401 [Sphingobium jiangsuense]|uniref:Uncharacterized protein n=1 Tax=Sphingobium jiangsuense TaxID=870476 RepID=A0A7W6BPC8_9SPHN|nr:hypothetical protein [Sphingobium jiangsuense]